MSSHHPLAPPGWAPPRGYSHGLVATGRVIALSGQVGWDPVAAAITTDDFVAQVKQALANVVTLLGEANATPSHLVRLTWYITDRSAYLTHRRAIGTAYREVLGSVYPPMSVVVVSALVEDRALVEIEATAVIPE